LPLKYETAVEAERENEANAIIAKTGERNPSNPTHQEQASYSKRRAPHLSLSMTNSSLPASI